MSILVRGLTIQSVDSTVFSFLEKMLTRKVLSKILHVYIVKIFFSSEDTNFQFY